MIPFAIRRVDHDHPSEFRQAIAEFVVVRDLRVTFSYSSLYWRLHICSSDLSLNGQPCPTGCSRFHRIEIRSAGVPAAGTYHFECGYEQGQSGPTVVVAVGSGVGTAIVVSLAAGFWV